MIKVTRKDAIMLFRNGVEIYLINDNGGEILVREEKEIFDSNFIDYEFGCE